jgi:hypothetical protein
VSGARLGSTALALGAIALGTPRLGAQELGWSGTAEASGNLLYGAARGRVASAALGVGRADSTLQVRGDAQFTYADARAGDDDRTKVTARAFRSTLALDHRPYARLSPFAFGGVETSLQQRVASRVSGGAGAKLTLHRHGDDDVSVSLALLAERTRTLHPTDDEPRATERVRWSWRVRVRRRFSEAVRLTHVTFYQPAVDRPGRYTVDSNTGLAVTVTRALALTAALRERYDSEARTRGARSNHDGQVLFGVRATF